MRCHTGRSRGECGYAFGRRRQQGERWQGVRARVPSYRSAQWVRRGAHRCKSLKLVAGA